MPGLFIFDFDLTITSQHIHNLIMQGHQQGLIDLGDQESIWSYVKEIPASMDNDAWRELLEDLIDAGHFVGIATFNEFQFIVKRYLGEALKISDHYLQKIHIEAWLPQNPMLANKNKHINEIIRHFDFIGEKDHIIFVDDSDHNCLAAKEVATHCIIVPHGKIGTLELSKIYEQSRYLAQS